MTDTQPPRIDRCQSPPPFIRRSAADRFVFDRPLFSDNSHRPVIVTRTPPEPDNEVDESFPLGTTRLRYTASDPFGNTVTCFIDIVVQGFLL